MFDGLSPEVEALLNAAKSDLPAAEADAGLLNAMVLAMSTDATAPLSIPRRQPMLGKVLTAKAAAIAGVLVLTGGVASAATGTLPGPVQDTASNAVEHVGLHIPKSDDDEATHDANDDNGVDDPATHDANDDNGGAEHPDNHGKDVSTVAHDESNSGRDHGSAVCTVASDGKCQPNAEDDHSGEDNSGEHRRDGEHRSDDGEHHEVTTSTTEVNDDDHSTPTTVEDHEGHHGGDDNSDTHGSDD